MNNFKVQKKGASMNNLSFLSFHDLEDIAHYLVHTVVLTAWIICCPKRPLMSCSIQWLTSSITFRCKLDCLPEQVIILPIIYCLIIPMKRAIRVGCIVQDDKSRWDSVGERLSSFFFYRDNILLLVNFSKTAYTSSFFIPLFLKTSWHS